MLGTISSLLGVFLKLGAVALVLNEVRGLVLAVPVLYGMYQAGGTAMAIWLGISSLLGIAASVVVPLVAAKAVQRRLAKPALSAIGQRELRAEP
ncbi:hypothetical protein [Tsuneonella amylolytica]|uniref:hypothetical protein n=1 Tax=Tsuneonella amylolytica TaxID=2338327 RepID=UPI000EAA8865|nr:hypothetical protein [Tsuneonella amylolytica]